jgi:hypothetical protein
MPLPRLHLRTLMVTVPLAGVILAIEAAAWIGPFGEGPVRVWLLSIAWVPLVSLLLDPKLVGWLGTLAASAMALAPCLAALGVLGRERALGAFLPNLWLTVAFGIGYVATRAGHLPDRRRAPDTRPEADSHARCEGEDRDGAGQAVESGRRRRSGASGCGDMERVDQERG